MSSRFSVPRRMWSMTRPGVPTTIWTPRCKTAELPLVRLAAVDRQRLDVLVAAVLVQRLGDLDRQLARRGQDQRLDRALLGIDGLDDRQPEGGRLAGAGLRLGDHVAAGEQDRDDLDLDRRRLLVADVLDRFQQRGVEPELLERWSVVGLDFVSERAPSGSVAASAAGSVAVVSVTWGS